MVKSFLIIILNRALRYYLNELTLKKEEFKEKKFICTLSWAKLSQTGLPPSGFQLLRI